MRRVTLLLCLLLAANLPQAWAQNPSPNCPQRPAVAEGGTSDVVLEGDPNTYWRPRGAEVRFTVKGQAGPVSVSKVRVCFGWGSPVAVYQSIHALIPSPQVRPIASATGAATYGAVVPALTPVPNRYWWPWRLFTSVPYLYTGADTVPVADMVVEITTSDGQVVVSSDEVGVTNVAVAWGVVLLAMAALLTTLQVIARYRGIEGRSLLLRIISTKDGYASLSQLQVLLWTAVVGMSAIYVMTLSGNLINITEGTLTLLGIASAAALLVRVPIAGQSATAPDASTGAGPAPPIQPALPVTPEWADLVIADRQSREIDITRLQMLAFTVITAVFVMITVVVDYEIPEIPANFLLLMGMSNGVYVTGRHLPSPSKTSGG